MPTINDLRRERSDINSRIQALAVKPTLTAEEDQQFQALTKQFNDVTSQIQRMEQAEQLAAQAATPVASPAASPAAPQSPPSSRVETVTDPRQSRIEQQMVFTGRLNMLFRADGNRAAALEIAKGMSFASETVKAGIVRALDPVAQMAVNTESGGGQNLVPTILSPQVIDYLYPQAVVRNLNGGISAIAMPNGNINLGRVSAPPIASYTGRNANVKVSSPTIDQVNMKSKKLTCLTPVARDLLRFAGISVGVEGLIMTSIGRSMGTAEDLGFIRGDGTGTNIKGWRYWAPSSTNVLNATSLTGLSLADGTKQAAIVGDIGRLEAALLNANVQLFNTGWVMAPRTRVALTNLRTTTGAPVFPEMQEPRPLVGPDGLTRYYYFLRGRPIGETTQVPINLTSGGASGNGSEIYLAELGYWVRGDAVPLEFAISTEATYTDPGTSLPVNAFEKDETLIRGIVENDFAPFQAVAVAVLDGVIWQ